MDDIFTFGDGAVFIGLFDNLVHVVADVSDRQVVWTATTSGS
jgi:hypothetical protein